MIILPRQTTPQSSVQTLTINGEPWSGWFTLTYPVGQTYNVIPVSITEGSNIITVPDSSQFSVGTFVSLTTIASWESTAVLTSEEIQLYAQVGTSSGSTVTLVQPLTGSSPGSPANAVSTGNIVALVGYCETTPLPFNATAAQIQTALTSLPVVGNGNVVCSGGPLPTQPITIQFTNDLSDQPVAVIEANTSPVLEVGINEVGYGSIQEMADANGSPLTISASVVQTTGGVSSASQQTAIAPADLQAMRTALDQIRPLTTLITTQNAAPITTTQPANNSLVSSSQFQVLRYETGRGSVAWPPLDATHWIQGSIEHEAPTALNSASQNYQGFHNISTVIAYTESALNDTGYGPGTYTATNYWDSLIGQFSQAQLQLCPGLYAYLTPSAQFLPTYSVADEPTPLVISTVGGQSVINGAYPIDYYSLPGVVIPTASVIWASMERTQGTDYLEIDLGTAQAINYLYFEATSKPFSISLAYDVLDQSPARNFQSVTIAPGTLGSSTTNLTYTNTATNLWQDCQIGFTNQFGGMLYSRYLRLGFTRTPANSPFQPNLGPIIPYSIEVRNLRVGRNVSTADAGITMFGPLSMTSSATTTGSTVPTSPPVATLPESLLLPSPTLFP